MKKVVRLGTAKTYGGRSYSIFCEIEYKNNRLSISGVEGPLPSGNCIGGCGQIDMEYPPDKPLNINPAPNWNVVKIRKFFEIWRKWHLNDMRSGCEHQRELGWDYNSHHGLWKEVYKPNPEFLIDEYADGSDGEYLPKWDEYQGHLCPVCGYSIGSSWLMEEVPQDVINWLFELPSTDVKPAWV